MREVPLNMDSVKKGHARWLSRRVEQDYRGTSLIRNCPPPQDCRRALGIVLL